jgi:TonB-linked SusC/RagA family outer membrane protein
MNAYVGRYKLLHCINKKFFKSFLAFKLTFVLLLSFSLYANAEKFNEKTINNDQPPVEIRGKVIDKNGLPLEGVSVKIVGTSRGTTTNKDGVFVIMADIDKKAQLEISIVGFKTQIVAAKNNISITLEDSVEGLSDIIVVGYGTAKKSDLVGSVAQIKADKLVDRPIVNVGNGLQGKIAGVQVVNQGGGVPGGQPMIRIRGTNSINTNSDPLFVVDGIIGVANALSTLNPQDIVSMELLKDASATAIYGARGANGVIMITTKRGISGKTQVDYSGSVSRNVLQRHLYAMNADQLMYVYEQAMANGDKYGTINRAKDFRGQYASGQSYSEMPWLFEQVPKGSYILDLVGKDGNYYKPIYNTNWEDYAFKPSTNTDHHIDMRGGGETAKYSASFGYTDQRGLMTQSWFKRYRVFCRFTSASHVNVMIGIGRWFKSIIFPIGIVNGFVIISVFTNQI